MKVICAWCGEVIKDDGEPDGIISHGICAKCNEKVEQELKEYEKKDHRHRLYEGAPGPRQDREIHPA